MEQVSGHISLTPVELPRLEKQHFFIITATYKSADIEKNKSDKYYFKVKTISGATVGKTVEVEFQFFSKAKQQNKKYSFTRICASVGLRGGRDAEAIQQRVEQNWTILQEQMEELEEDDFEQLMADLKEIKIGNHNGFDEVMCEENA